ncbi:MAG TPA: sensor histidine kinase [Burkholderiaceae bacterium]|nr:sensor histidine kinase [Burkholderiaceae bacterium]
MNVAELRQSLRCWWSFSMRPCGPAWLQIIWTMLFNTAIAVVLTLIAWGFAGRSDPLRIFMWNLVIAQSIGLTIHALFDAGGYFVGRERIESFSTRNRMIFFAGIPIIGCVIGYWIGLTLLGVDVGRIVQGAPRVVVAIVTVSIIFSTFWYRHLSGKRRLAHAEAESERERARAVELQRQAIDAQLRSLQAQIEPHFLFNTLANVVSLIDTAPDKARLMLERLIELLRASLAASRSERTTLGQEAALVAAYLDILRIRMGERLSYTINVPPDLMGAHIPPLSLQPLVENSIKHGLEPKLEGGSVHLIARTADGALQLDVEDDGMGFSPQAGAGVGLANLRERMSSLYGGKARLVVEELARGTRVRMTIPLAQIEQA